MKDILQTADIDLKLTIDADIIYGESTLQHQRDILLAHKGEYRLSPTLGVGISDFLEDEGPENMNREINRQFSSDGMTVQNIDANLNIIAGY